MVVTNEDYVLCSWLVGEEDSPPFAAGYTFETVAMLWC